MADLSIINAGIYNADTDKYYFLKKGESVERPTAGTNSMPVMAEYAWLAGEMGRQS
jgi:hypothetical protein